MHFNENEIGTYLEGKINLCNMKEVADGFA